jgi:23S rRNA (guanosine2251-2'-O)-methyltransferase
MKPQSTQNPRRHNTADDGPVRLFGVHAVEAALKNPARQIGRLLVTDNAEHRLEEALQTRQAKPQRVTPRDLDRLLGTDTVHQGVCLETQALPEPELEDIVQRAQGAGPIVVLDQITDPHNVGAILRTAAAFSASGLIMTRRHSPPLSGTLAKSASGALEHVPVALVSNLARTLSELQEMGVWRVGLSGDGPTSLEGEPLTGALALVLGAEGKGLRRLTRDLCDTVCRIDIEAAIGSLNVSNAAAIALHLIAMRRRRT